MSISVSAYTCSPEQLPAADVGEEHIEVVAVLGAPQQRD